MDTKLIQIYPCVQFISNQRNNISEKKISIHITLDTYS